MNKIPLTVQGAEKMRQELNQLKTIDRPQVIDDIAEARAHGDLKENAEYHAAREQQGFIEGRIQDLEAKLSNAQEIDISSLPQNGKVVFGVTVDLEDEDSGEAVTYKIVGDDESNIKEGKISVNSPIARAMIGKEEGEVAVVQAPSGIRNLEIVEVRYIV
ncbi:MAG: transcription elongation factor GreA [Gammaproteobacteria bacterium]|jgi:transcription elongation factor GreA|nr:transcription elongation factor GreA [Gammaproteobacteria bacterium]MBT3488367.1 transcription elongation factor GreA [Gammaproteobacteria bacterium]MBT3719442.1 transcription elongation factor GreA [Gammaproteobacteria bacterium]MBT3845599.1 transcription elongation factor GreA [Gammaproteobacteria bacterium]MBT3894129.1 transcription elongation factor GreA [Gammaproteobacteria bacterium]